MASAAISFVRPIMFGIFHLIKQLCGLHITKQAEEMGIDLAYLVSRAAWFSTAFCV